MTGDKEYLHEGHISWAIKLQDKKIHYNWNDEAH